MPNTTQHYEPVFWVSISDGLRHSLNMESCLVVEIVLASLEVDSKRWWKVEKSNYTFALKMFLAFALESIPTPLTSFAG